MKHKTDIAPGFSRQSANPNTVKLSTEVLIDPLNFSRGVRKSLMAARSNVIINDEAPTPRHPAVKFALKLRSLTQTQLGRRLKQFARRAATAKNILAKLSSDSRFRPAIQAQQDASLGCFGQVIAELKARQLAVDGRLAPSQEVA